MATYSEIRSLFSDSALVEKVEVAIVISANSLLAGTPTTAEKAWAASVAGNPRIEAQKALMFVLAENKDLDYSLIQGASDVAIQTRVDAVRSILVDALAGV